MFGNPTEKLLIASKEGDIKSVQKILSKKKIDINCKDILIQKYSFNSKSYFFIKFKFIIIFGIRILHLIGHHFIMRHIKVILK